MDNNLPKGITKRGAKYRVSCMVSGKRTTATCKSLTEALQALQRFRRGLIDDEHAAEHAVWTVGAAWEKYIDYRVAKAVNSTSNHKKFTWYGKIILNYFGPALSLDDITQVKVTDFYNYLTIDKKYSASCTNYLGTLLYQMQLFSQERGRKRFEPKRMKTRRTAKGRIRFVSEAEEARILEWFRLSGKDDEANLFSFYIDTGLRKTEGLRLKFNDVDMKTGRITVWETKTNQPRTVRMTKRVRSILAGLKLRSISPSDRVFAHMSERRFYRDWLEMREELGFDDDLVIHTCRHTCCTRLLSGGVNIRTVMTWMGHSSIQMTQRYAHFIPRTLDDAVDALDKLSEVAEPASTVTSFRPLNRV